MPPKKSKKPRSKHAPLVVRAVQIVGTQTDLALLMNKLRTDGVKTDPSRISRWISGSINFVMFNDAVAIELATERRVLASDFYPMLLDCEQAKSAVA